MGKTKGGTDMMSPALWIKMGAFQRVEQFEGTRGYVRNQFVLFFKNAKVFQSYHSLICMQCQGVIYLDENKWNYSRTTSKYRAIFLRESTRETEAKIKRGVYKLVDLN